MTGVKIAEIADLRKSCQEAKNGEIAVTAGRQRRNNSGKCDA
jgi:hypothetical protein